MEKLRRSGYSQETRKDVLYAGVKGYMRKVKRDILGGRKSIETVMMTRLERKERN